MEVKRDQDSFVSFWALLSDEKQMFVPLKIRQCSREEPETIKEFRALKILNGLFERVPVG